MTFPPLPEPETLITETQEISEATGLEDVMPGMGALMAAMTYIIHDACAGESKDCTCNVCVRLRETGEAMVAR